MHSVDDDDEDSRSVTCLFDAFGDVGCPWWEYRLSWTLSLLTLIARDRLAMKDQYSGTPLTVLDDGLLVIFYVDHWRCYFDWNWTCFLKCEVVVDDIIEVGSLLLSPSGHFRATSFSMSYRSLQCHYGCTKVSLECDAQTSCLWEGMNWIFGLSCVVVHRMHLTTTTMMAPTTARKRIGNCRPLEGRSPNWRTRTLWS